MTASDYFRYCGICYDANQYFEENGQALSAMGKYRRMADGRHGGLLDIEAHDPIAFEAWYCGEDRIGTHPWEICRGGNQTHISLRPVRLLEGKWQLVLSGFSNVRFLETVRMALALYDAGIRFRLDCGREMARMAKGIDNIGIVPKHITPGYCDALFPKEDRIFFFCNPWYDPDDAEKIRADVDWYDIAQQQITLI